jgi:hypothetical protein
MSEAELETARLLARFKLMVRRSLDRSVNLAAMQADPVQAAAVLDEIEELADDEELLTRVVRLRERLLASAPEALREPLPEAEVPATVARPSVRDYRFGARGS